MAITQLSAFLANKPGTLAQAVAAISEAGVNMRALSVADTSDFGVLRVIVSDVAKTKEVLSEHTIASETPVIAVRMDDRAGSLKEILDILQAAEINIEYVYAFTTSGKGNAYVVMRVDDIPGAEDVLQKNGKATLSDDDLTDLL